MCSHIDCTEKKKVLELQARQSVDGLNNLSHANGMTSNATTSFKPFTPLVTNDRLSLIINLTKQCTYLP